ncbi:FAD-binding domain-containing protein [Parathielavia appendiculata]|uniref:FAD-binding domain-containing protein n=1 Tax=Parathielavia appendiculata TaxID=2587402 RepID=A0AAN6TTL8_9PEZI|nr:FAD-binding domain-containing protein [Parathielavia appendiculata]
MASSAGTGGSSRGRSWNAAAAGAVRAVGFGAGALFTRTSTSSGDARQKGDDADTPSYANRDEILHTAEEIASVLGQDASTSNTPERAVAVVYPKTTEDVSAIARICNRRSVPMVPFGAGSSIEGNFSQPHSGICINFSNMDKILAFHPDDMDVVVQPGVNWVDLNNHIASSGLFAPMDPSPTATVGGMVSTNCSGTNAFRYGTMKDWVLNLTVVLADGTVIKTRRRPRKTSAGYNLTSLFVGAEGTLGVVTEATLKLAPIPQATSVAVVPFPTIHAAAAAATALIRSGIQLAALEIMDDRQMAILNSHGSPTVRKRHWAEQPTLFLKFSGTTESVQSDIARTSSLLHTLTTTTTTTTSDKSEPPPPFHFARTKQEEHDLWAARKEFLFTMTSLLPENHRMWSTDVAVPISRLAELITWSEEQCSSLGVFASVIGHTAALAGCVHEMMKRALDLEGTVSGEHAIGIGKKVCLVQELGEDTVEVMRRLKRAVDPKWVMNPGKVFDYR